jgi:hypothetical protein
MKCVHEQLAYEIDDEWIAEAGLSGFKPRADHYRTRPDGDVFLVEITSVEPLLERATSRGIFCDDLKTGTTAKQRVIRILQWFRDDCEIEPVVVIRSVQPSFKYKLLAGCHRFHCANAVGFKWVPAVMEN